jgi:HlyD family secretion protein
MRGWRSVVGAVRNGTEICFAHLVASARLASANVAAAKAALASALQQNKVLSAQRREAEAKLAQAQAALDGARTDLDKTVVKAPVDGAILKVDVRLGEYAQAGVLSNPLMTMGSIEPLHVRVDIDESDSWRVHKDSPAVASLRGNPAISVALSFVRFEPYVLPKRSLTGDTAERVDTRVLQAIYAFAPGDFPAFVGQQVDVFVKAPTRAEATHSPTSGRIAFGPTHYKPVQLQYSGALTIKLIESTPRGTWLGADQRAGRRALVQP